MKKDSFNKDFFNSEEELDVSKDKTLWLAVILQAFLDATKEITENETEESKWARARAKAWFSAEAGVTAKDFSRVCENAGLDPQYTQSFAIKVLNGDVPFERKRINALLTHT